MDIVFGVVSVIAGFALLGLISYGFGKIGERHFDKKKAVYIVKAPYNKTYIHLKTLGEKMIFRYKFSNREAIDFLCNYILDITYKFNQDNETHVSSEDVASLIFERYQTKYRTLTIEDIKNKHFGYAGYITICCVLLADKEYQKQFRDNTELWDKIEFCVEGYSDKELKRAFITIMDNCYIDWHFKMLQESQSIKELDNKLDGEFLFDMAIERFKQKYNLISDEFMVEKQ